MYDFLMATWPWWFFGILIGLVVPMLLVLAGKSFGISTSLQQMGAVCAPNSKWKYFSGYDRRSGMWTLYFVFGIALGGWIGSHLLSADPVEFLPESMIGSKGYLSLIFGGFLVGFGARYAGGCTSGHSITGIAHLNVPSLLATICFFAGGLGVTWGLGKWIFGEVE